MSALTVTRRNGDTVVIGDPDNPIAVGARDVISEVLCIRTLQLKGIRIKESAEPKNEAKAKESRDE